MGYLYALAVSPGLLRICASNIGPADLFHRNGTARENSPYTRAFAAQLKVGDGTAYALWFAARVDQGSVAIEALEQAALARFAATPTTGMRELFEATARCLGLPVPVQDFGGDDWDDDDCRSPNPYFG